ncbi:Arylsulfatase [Planctomycetes bacterium CA13]|uniref:Arylsulfatase n=1 Tax=Novipirellula herctigrandis TaxID=2527986 RepID=A0A5C5Z023_9BACT|nr:Arylsulfatase [Planctomycetes bacterium CA13]
MRRNNMLLWVMVILLASTPSFLIASQPNIVLIMADDMGYECLGANGATSVYKTPNLDRLAAEGIRFEHAYSQLVCTPSRVQIMTGRYNARNYTGFGALQPNEITFGNVMKNAGYKTCVAGKWQLGGGVKGPTNFGFDEYCLWQLTRRPSRFDDPGLEMNGKEVDYPGEYGPEVITNYLIDFMKRNKEEPFFVYYPMVLPHFPFHKTPDGKKYDKNKTDLDLKSYYFRDMVAYADKMVGKVEQAIVELGLSENTLIILTCDNGTDKKVTTRYKGKDIMGGKGTTPNAGTHVPFIANWPGTIKPGQVSQELVDFSDLLPTLADLGGGSVPQDRVIDGRSFLPLLKGEPMTPRDWVYCWYQRDGKRNGSAKVFARNQTYKLDSSGKFYNVPADELEQSPLTPEGIDAKAQKTRLNLKAVIDKIDLEATNSNDDKAEVETNNQGCW